MDAKKKNLSLKKILKRDNSLVTFDPERITNAIYKAMTASEEGSYAEAQNITKRIIQDLNITSKKTTQFVPRVEELQDIVEKHLILAGYVLPAKNYILYREKHAKLRAQKQQISNKVNQLMTQSSQYFKNNLSYLIYLRTYARWIEEEKRRETWIETVDRYIDFMREIVGKRLSKKQYQLVRKALLNQDVTPSMRLMQFAGPAVRKNHITAYNCSYVAPTCLEDFGEIMYISMCGCGVGFSVESQNIQQLPIIKKQTNKKQKTHVIDDSKEGWCTAFVLGLKSWFNGDDLQFDFSKLRAMGSRLKTSGGKSSGPEPLKKLFEFARSKILQRQGRRLSNLDAHDLLCKIGEIVIAGGVRRSAMISLSDLDDIEMRTAKTGAFFYKEPQRSYANNSAVYEAKPNNEILLEEWQALIKSGSGERGIFNRGSLPKSLSQRRKKLFTSKGLITDEKITGFIGVNPCGEIILQSKQFCNLTEIIARPEDTKQTLLQKIRIASLLGTYQAMLTHFPYLSKEWKQHCEEEALLGVSISGHWDSPAVRDKSTLIQLKNEAIRINKIYAKKFGIKAATAVTCVKPSGTVSLVADCSPGMHPRYAKYYLRRVRISATDALFKMLKDQGIPYHPEVGYSAESSPTYVMEFPVAAPKNAILRNDLTAKEHLEYWKLVKTHYTEHNPSVTISVGKNEWIEVLDWINQNWDLVGGLSFLPRSEDVYRLQPFEEISKEKYELLKKQFKDINFSKLIFYE